MTSVSCRTRTSLFDHFGGASENRERATEIAAEFVQLNVNVIVTGGAALVIAAKQATSRTNRWLEAHSAAIRGAACDQ